MHLASATRDLLRKAARPLHLPMDDDSHGKQHHDSSLPTTFTLSTPSKCTKEGLIKSTLLA